MLGTSSNGLPAPVATVSTAAVVAPDDPHAPLVEGSPLARTLFSLYSGEPATVVQSPPGAGKSTLLAQVVAHLFDNTDATATIAVFTNVQGSAVAERLATVLGTGPGGRPRVTASSNIPVNGHVAKTTDQAAHHHVQVRTIASCMQSRPTTDLLLVDEAYQVTFAAFAEAADAAAQVLAVGDPGQIGPVVPFDAGAWERMTASPAQRAPEVLIERHGAVVIDLPTTFRLGPQSAAAVAPLYDFGFDSGRLPRHIDGFDGEITALLAPPAESPFDIGTLSLVAKAAVEYVGAMLTETHLDGTVSVRPLTDADVAVVVSRNGQASALSALLAQAGHDKITVGTADRLQGGQWHAVVALDPTVAGAESQFALSSGRLCVMASRHMTHLTWVHDSTWRDVLDACDDRADAERASLVRSRLVGEDE